MRFNSIKKTNFLKPHSLKARLHEKKNEDPHTRKRLFPIVHQRISICVDLYR